MGKVYSLTNGVGKTEYKHVKKIELEHYVILYTKDSSK